MRSPESAVPPAKASVDLSLLGLPITGTYVDLACAPAHDASGDAPRFRNHGDYVAAFVRQVNHLRKTRFLLPEDASMLRQSAAMSEVPPGAVTIERESPLPIGGARRNVGAYRPAESFQ